MYACVDLRTDIFLGPGYYNSMGFAVPAALAAELAWPKRRAVALVGDGGFQMTGMDLGTATTYGLDPIVILFNNKLRHQKAALIVAGFLMAFALIVNRWDTNLMGLLVPSAYTTAVMPQVDINYSPTWVEWATAGGILGYWLMAFSLGAKYLPVFKQEPEAEDEHVAAPAPAMAQA
jgi:hypothetical protein